MGFEPMCCEAVDLETTSLTTRTNTLSRSFCAIYLFENYKCFVCVAVRRCQRDANYKNYSEE